jgi:dihydrofolate synthase / folylpolyglutamate synthase
MKNVPFPLHGLYQERNVAGVLKSVEILQRYFTNSNLDLEHGLSDVVASTGLKGRWQTLLHGPTVVCDTAHNESGVSEVLRQISLQQFNRLFMIWGMVRDKDVSHILSLLPKDAIYYFCQAKIPRALDAKTLQGEATKFGLTGEAVADVNEARKKALSRATAEDFIFIGGSTYVVAEIDEL